MINEFENLCLDFSFVDSWNDPQITPDTFRIYARNIPAKEESRNFIHSVEQIHSQANRRQRKYIDLQRQMYSNQE